ncbi:MAG: hypothetical protein KC516_03450 [Nanoarchaeota archaeon]|nr:hypothetical protein [Nanoarchaeota archaeon]
MVESSVKKKRLKGILYIYYSKPEIQKAIFDFCENRETVPRYFEGFGKRPDTLQYQGDIFELVKRGATSFHCSEEIWEDPLKLSSDFSEEETNQIREGWDLLLDVDCKYFDFAKMTAKAIIKTLDRFGVENIGIKFSGSKGFHIIVPWKAFPKEINGIKTSDLFPELPRKIIGFLREYSQKVFREELPDDFYHQFKNVNIKRGIKCRSCDEIAQTYDETEFYCNFCRIAEIRKLPKDTEAKKYFCPECKRELTVKKISEFLECKKCNKDSKKNPGNFTSTEEIDLFELMGLDLILVSPRHLFRAPYSLHEKTGLASTVITREELKNFDLKDADPMKIRVRNFLPEVRENEAAELVMESLDWAKNREMISGDQEKITGKYAEFKPIKLKEIKDEQFPPSINKILSGLEDGRKRALFVLINTFRSIGMEKEELEKKIFEWNKKNKPPLKEGLIKAQLKVSYRRKPIMPPNFNSEYYKAVGAQLTEEEIRMKNPVSFIIRKNLGNKKKKTPKKKKS